MTIVSIVYKPRDIESRPADHYSRVALQTAQLVVGHGIEDDVKGGHPTRQINIMCARKLQKLKEQGYTVEAGMMGEQIMITGIDLSALKPGDRLQLGAVAVVEMTDHRNGCLRFQQIQGLPTPTTTRFGSLGIMAKVVVGGQIHVGDAVQTLVAEPAPGP